MRLTISIRFLTGRAHLHHWQAHHSDGKTDWPPSPWRLLRALVAVAGRGLTTLPDPDFICNPVKKPKATKKNPTPLWSSKNYESMPDNWHGSDMQADEIPLSRLAALLAVLAPTPEIWLPKTSGGHTRQFFPIHENGIVKNSGSAVFDTFSVVRKDQPILFYWPDVEFDQNDQRLKNLKLILQRMTYFGRAESWCQAEVHTVSPEQINDNYVLRGETQTHWVCVCIEDGGKPEGQEYRGYTLERKLAPLPIDENGQGELSEEVTQLLPRTNKTSSNRPKSKEEFSSLLQREPASTLLLRCLLRESGQDMKDGLERPIGARWVHYAVPRAIYDLPGTISRKPTRRQEIIHVIRYTLNTASVHRPVLPPLTDTLLVADKFRNAAMALHESPSRNLSGHETDGTPCCEHDHAFYWPADEDNDGFIDHVTVYCPRGFEMTEIDALRRLTRLRQRGGRPDLLVTPIYSGDEKNFRPWSTEQGQTSIFVSATPYFCPVHLTHGRGNSGRIRPIKPEIIKGMKKQGIIADEAEIRSILEIVFDYSPGELAETIMAVTARKITEPVPLRQYFPVIDPPAEYPPLSSVSSLSNQQFLGASLKDPDTGFPFGLSVGLFVNDGTRFIRAISFCRRRRHYEAKGYGRMFRIEFAEPRNPRPFAIGDQCHFGLGQFIPVEE